MGTALYLEFENEIPGYDPRASVLGEPLSRVIQFGKGQVDLICHSDGLTQIYEFYSESNEEAFAKIGEPVPPGLKLDPIKWTAPEEGLRAIDAVLACSEIDANRHAAAGAAALRASCWRWREIRSIGGCKS